MPAWLADLLIVSSYYSFSEFRTASYFRLIKFLKDFILHSHDWKYLNFLTDECVSDHSERIRSIQIDKNFITQTFRLVYNFIISRTEFLTVLLMMKLYIRNVWVIKFLSIWIDLILSLWSETHSSVKKFKYFQTYHSGMQRPISITYSILFSSPFIPFFFSASTRTTSRWLCIWSCFSSLLLSFPSSIGVLP